jgi:hypothetical protein
MKSIVYIIGLGLLLPVTQGADNNTYSKTMSAIMVRTELCSVAFQAFMKNNKEAMNSAALYQINAVDADSQKIIDAVAVNYKLALKDKIDFTTRDGVFYDIGSGRRCTIIRLKVESCSRGEAVVTVEWSSSKKSGGGVAYLLAATGEVWSIRKELSRYTI